MTPENGKNDTKYDEKIQNNRLPVGFLILYLETFLQVLLSYMSVPIFVHVRETQLDEHSAEYLQVALSSHFATPTSETHIRRKLFTSSERCAKFPDFRACLGPLKCD